MTSIRERTLRLFQSGLLFHTSVEAIASYFAAQVFRWEITVDGVLFLITISSTSSDSEMTFDSEAAQPWPMKNEQPNTWRWMLVKISNELSRTDSKATTWRSQRVILVRGFVARDACLLFSRLLSRTIYLCNHRQVHTLS